MTASTQLSRFRVYLRGSWRLLLKEVSAFGLIGALAFVLDLGTFTWFTHAVHVGALKSKLISTIISTAFSYWGNRYLSFSHRARTSIGRETAFFFGINGLTLIFSEVALAVTVYVFHYGHASSMVAAVNIVTIALGTVFRFWSYKRFVFLHPDRVHASQLTVDIDEELAE